MDQMRHLARTASELDDELGPWASSFYIHWSILRYRTKMAKAPELAEQQQRQEALYLLRKFSMLRLPPGVSFENLDLDSASPKSHTLLDVLAKEMRPTSACIVFVKTRAAVTLLSIFLSIHPRTRNFLRVGTVIGASNNQARKARLGDWGPTNDQLDILDDLRTGKKNIIICTSVLEEGIDITLCNTIICFEPPVNLISFIQRRGRARHIDSKFVVMLSDGNDHDQRIRSWQEMEEIMKIMYADTMREVQEIRDLDDSDQGYKELTTKGGYVHALSHDKTH